MSEEGRISDDEFVAQVIRRVVTRVGSTHGSNQGGAVGGIVAGLAGSFLGDVLGNLMGGSALTNDVTLSLFQDCSTKCAPLDNKTLELEIELD